MELHPRVLDYPQSDLGRMIPDEAELTAGVHDPSGPVLRLLHRHHAVHRLQGLRGRLQGVEQPAGRRPRPDRRQLRQHRRAVGQYLAARAASSSRACASDAQTPFQSGWLMMSDVCKHCHNAPCLEACPTGALFRTEFDTVVVQQDICNGCGYCVPACPFGVVDVSPLDGKAHKCTLCYDRLKGGLEPACAKACPTNSIQFGEVGELQERAQAAGRGSCTRPASSAAYLYGTPGAPGATGGLGHLNAFFLLTAAPETYNLPRAPTRPARRVAPSLAAGLAAVASLALMALAMFSRRD